MICKVEGFTKGLYNTICGCTNVHFIGHLYISVYDGKLSAIAY